MEKKTTDKDMYSTCDAWIIVNHFYFHVKIPQSDVQQPHWFNVEFLHTLQNGPLWFWFKNTIVPFPKGHESLYPRGSPCPQAQQCAQIDFKTISAQALERKKRTRLQTTAPRPRVWKGWGGYTRSILKISAAYESLTQYSIKMEKEIK